MRFNYRITLMGSPVSTSFVVHATEWQVKKMFLYLCCCINDGLVYNRAFLDLVTEKGAERIGSYRHV